MDNNKRKPLNIYKIITKNKSHCLIIFYNCTGRKILKSLSTSPINQNQRKFFRFIALSSGLINQQKIFLFQQNIPKINRYLKINRHKSRKSQTQQKRNEFMKILFEMWESNPISLSYNFNKHFVKFCSCSTFNYFPNMFFTGL